MARTHGWAAGRAAVLVLACVMACASCGGSSGGSPSSSSGTVEAAHRFLSDYATGDGRVLRRDQGGDIVSEGQAYGMLIAELADRPGTARTIWGWTKAHLRRPDGLLSFHADASGRVLDQSSATDADTLAAYALLRYDGPDADALHRDGRRLARAVLAHETVPDGSHGLVPVAGNWATGTPAVVDPSYWMPGVSTALAGLTGDDRWRRVTTTTVRLLADATGSGHTLPTDWTRLTGGRLESTGAPDGSAPEQYGPDAQRLPIWFSAGCDASASHLAAAWAPALASDDRAAALALTPDGSVINGQPTPLGLLAAAAAARAAGNDDRAARFTDRATRQARSTPTYYGDAWVVLAAGLADGSLAGCD